MTESERLAKFGFCFTVCLLLKINSKIDLDSNGSGFILLVLEKIVFFFNFAKFQIIILASLFLNHTNNIKPFQA